MRRSAAIRPAVADPGRMRLADPSGREPEAPAPGIKPGVTLAAAIEPLLSHR